MMRNKASSSMQKTYDECFLVCSTAVYFEAQVSGSSSPPRFTDAVADPIYCQQNNEAEALRSWRSALDQIYYHNAYRVPPNYQPKSETERALQESLRNMELQCKERVDLLETLRKSRKESKDSMDRSSGSSSMRGRPAAPMKPPNILGQTASAGWIGDGTIPPVNYPPAVSYPNLSRAQPPLPNRPALPPRGSNHSSATPSSPAMLPVPPKKTSRTPSPDKKGRVMLTTLRGPKDGKKHSKSPRASGGLFKPPPPVSSKAAGLAWDSTSKASGQRLGQSLAGGDGSTTTVDSLHRNSWGGNTSSRPDSTNVTDGEDQALGGIALVRPGNRSPPDLISLHEDPRLNVSSTVLSESCLQSANGSSEATRDRHLSPTRPKASVDYPPYRSEFPQGAASSKATAQFLARTNRDHNSKNSNSATLQRSPQRNSGPPGANRISRHPVANISSPRLTKHNFHESGSSGSSDSNEENTRSREIEKKKGRKSRESPIPVDPALESINTERDPQTTVKPSPAWHERVKHIKKHLPKGVDESAAKQIFNEIVVQGDEVHWDDVAGLEVAKKALKEAVVYPFLRPDLFMGLREPARGMLLFGPPGTGKTMLARAVATESRSTFFAISASSLTSKWLGESEKLVRALFSLAKALAPSIIFVDEIDSLLSSRGGSSEHESTRRIKTEFLIQWSDLQRAAAGSKQNDKEKAEGDATRVLVLAATNMPWAIDEAARRRFVRRQYIPLPEAPVRGEQLRTLLGHQKHNLSKQDIQVLVELTDGTF